MIIGGMVTWGNLFPFIITASNFYGMLWVICSLGYGLVKYPKSYFDTCDLDVMKRYNLHKMGCSRNQLEKGLKKIKCVYRNILKFEDKNKLNTEWSESDAQEIKDCLERVRDRLPEYLQGLHINNITEECPEGFSLTDIFTCCCKDESYKRVSSLLNSERDLKTAIAALENEEKYLEEKFWEAMYYQEMVEVRIDGKPRAERSRWAKKFPRGCFLLRFPNFEVCWWTVGRKIWKLTMFTITGLLCLFILIAESTAFVHKQFLWHIMDFNSANKDTPIIEVLNYLVLSAIPIFVGFLSYYFLFSSKIHGFYVFQTKGTDPSSLLFFARHSQRLAPSICWNIMTLVFANSEGMKSTGFYKGIGDLDAASFLGYAVPVYMPVL